MKRILIFSFLSGAAMLIAYSCKENSSPVEQNGEADYNIPFDPDSFASRPLPENLRNPQDIQDLYSRMRSVQSSFLFLYGLSRSPVGNVVTDECDGDLTQDERLLLLRLLAYQQGVNLPVPTYAELESLFVVDSVDVIVSRGNPESLEPPVTVRQAVRRITFHPRSGPSYGYELRRAERLDESGIVSGYDWFYLHRAQGNHNGALLSWSTNSGWIRTTGVAIPKYADPIKMKCSYSFQYQTVDANHRRMLYPKAWRAERIAPDQCMYLDPGDTCTAVTVYHADTPTTSGGSASGHGYVWRPGCYSDDLCTDEQWLNCFVDSAPELTTDNHNASSRACAYVHLYSGSTPAYTGYNDGRWRVDASILEGQSASKIEDLIDAGDWDLFSDQTVYVLCKPYFMAWTRSYRTTPSDNWKYPVWYQMFQGTQTGTNWSTGSYDQTVWRGADNFLPYDHMWQAGLGCNQCNTQEQSVLLIWSAFQTNWYPFPFKAMSTYSEEPWANAGYIDCGHKIFDYGFGDVCGSTEAWSDKDFGWLYFGNNSYTTKLEITYNEIGIE